MRRFGLMCLLAAALFLVARSAAAPSAGTVSQAYAWARAFGGNSQDVAWTVQQTSDRGYAVGGYTWSFGAGGCDLWILKLNEDGAVQWQRTYGGGSPDAADLIIQTSDGGYLVAGYTASYGAGAIDMWLLKLSPGGSIQWQKAYGGHGEDEAVGIEQTRDGGYVMAGETASYGAGDWDVWILKLRSDGTVQWQKTYGGPELETTSADPIQQTSDGGYVVCGRTASFGAGGEDVWVLKLDANGAIQWQKTYGGPEDDEAHAMRQTLDGGYVVAGFTESFGAGEDDIWVLKLDASGAVQWQKTFGGEKGDITWSIYPTADGGSVVGGETYSFGVGDRDLWVLKLDANGALQWQKTYGGPGSDRAVSIRQTSDAGYVLAGATGSFGVGNSDLWVLKLDASGDIPGCPLVASSNATIVATQVVGVDSQARTEDTSCRIKNTSASARVSTASSSTQCYHVATPAATASPTPTASATRSPTPGGTVFRLHLPVIRK
jgi:predicted secreted protein